MQKAGLLEAESSMLRVGRWKQFGMRNEKKLKVEQIVPGLEFACLRPGQDFRETKD